MIILSNISATYESVTQYTTQNTTYTKHITNPSMTYIVMTTIACVSITALAIIRYLYRSDICTSVHSRLRNLFGHRNIIQEYNTNDSNVSIETVAMLDENTYTMQCNTQ